VLDTRAVKKLIKRLKYDSAERAQRARPDGDLTAWASRRDLDFRGQSAQAGYYSVTCPWSVDVVWNVVRGPLPGGSYGVVCHDVRLYEGLSAGEGSTLQHFKVPYTNAGVRVPHLGSLAGLHVARRSEHYTESSNVWSKRSLDDLDLRGWVATTRKHTDPEVVEQFITGPVRDILRGQQGLGFELRVEYGQAIAARQDFLTRDEDLDSLAATACVLAAAVRDICAPTTPSPSLGTVLAPPVWVDDVHAKPNDTFTAWPIGARLERVVQIGDERGLPIEDPRTFHQTFPGLNMPGEAFGVLRGTLPGTNVDARLIASAERPMWIDDEIRRMLTDPGGPVGCDVAAVAVPEDTPATPPEGVVEEGMRVAIADGVMTTWRSRLSWQVTGETLDQLGRDTAAAMARRGLA
jgi:hypothetical protein